MRTKILALSMLAVFGGGCTSMPSSSPVAMSDLPNCFDSNYDKERGLFTIRNDTGNPVNQQCLLTVSPRGSAASASRLTAGGYRIYLSSGGGGGAGGSLQAFHGGAGGGGGGGGAGALETQATVNLTEGAYKLTLGAGGPGGMVCVPRAGIGGGPGWLGSPSSMVRVATGEVVAGAPGADTYARPSRSQQDKMAGKTDAHGGTGPGQASGGHGSRPETRDTAEDQAVAGVSKLASGRSGIGGAPGTDAVDERRSGTGGGGGATSIGQGGAGGGETLAHKDIPPLRGSLGSGGGGGEGSSSQCDPGARGGHGYIALRSN